MKAAVKLAGALCGLAAMAFSNSAQANVMCTGPVYEVRVTAAGYLAVNWGAMGFTQFCSLVTSGNNPGPAISTETCKGIMTLALTAKGSGRDFGADTTANTCTGFTATTTWPNVPPTSFQVVN